MAWRQPAHSQAQSLAVLRAKGIAVEDELEFMVTVALVSALTFYFSLVACISLQGLLVSSGHVLF